MTTLIRILGYLLIGAVTVLLLESLCTLSIYIAIVLWFVIIVILQCMDESSKIHTDLQIYGCIYYGLFFYWLIFAAIHLKHIDASHVALYSPLLWHKIDEGEKVDTLSLRSHVDCEYYSHTEHVEVFYFLTVRDSIHIYNRFDLKMKIPKRHSIIQQPYYGGVLVDLIQTEGCVYSLDGELIDENWRPRIHDITPIDYTN